MAFSTRCKSIVQLPRWAWALIHRALILMVLSLGLLLLPDSAPKRFGWALMAAIAIGMAALLHMFRRVRQAHTLVLQPEYFQRALFIYHATFETYLRVTNKAAPEGVRSYNTLRHNEKIDLALAFLSYLSNLDRRWWSLAGIRNRIFGSRAFMWIGVAILMLLPPLKVYLVAEARRARRRQH